VSRARTDDRPLCAECRNSTEWKPDWLQTPATALVCTHPSALRINQGAVWLASLAREICRGRRFERKH
jgi:hypothetical protein